MTRRATGPGKTWVYLRSADQIQAALYNYDFDWHKLKPEHENLLLNQGVVDMLAGRETPASITVKAQASRMGHESYNQLLSGRRLDELLGYLRTHVAHPFNVRRIEAVGERAAALAGEPDRRDNPWYRSVVFTAWRHPNPPPPPVVQAPPDARMPCEYYRFKIRYYEGLRNAWSQGPGRVEDEGGDASSFRPTFEHFWGAMMSQGFSPGQRQSLWDSYSGVSLRDAPLAAHRYGEQAEYYRRQQHDQGCTSGSWDPPEYHLRPRQGHRDSEGNDGT